jgi:hypothetical protein
VGEVGREVSLPPKEITMLDTLEDAVMSALGELCERELGERLVEFELLPIKNVRQASDWTAEFMAVSDDGRLSRYRATGTFRLRAGGSETEIAARVVDWF